MQRQVFHNFSPRKYTFEFISSKFFLKHKKYLCVSSDIDPRDVLDYMYAKDKWNMKRHQLLLSVTGGSKKYAIPSLMKRRFKKGILKAAKSTDCIMITNGRNKLVGEAVDENTFNNKIDVLGIIPSHVVAFRSLLELKVVF